jgi:poly-beta-1,6-N-acetyl-D-glucosamine synthase
MDIINETYIFLLSFFQNYEDLRVYLYFFPIVLLIEAPLYLLMIIAIFRVFWEDTFTRPIHIPFYPTVSCVVTCYNEGKSIVRTLESLTEQLYRGCVEIIIVVDGADINRDTLKAAVDFQKNYTFQSNRYLRVIPKLKRGGHASSENLGVKLAKGKYVIILDGDCSCDNDMIASLMPHFTDKNIVGISGNIRVRNSKKNLVTRLQAIEYILGLQLSRIGLGKIGMINNISGAFGTFQKDFIQKIGGWKNGSAEDLDLVMRIKAYSKRYPKLKMIHEHQAIVHTDVPDNWRGLFKQRLRWEGDLYYIFFRRHKRTLSPKHLGWKVFFGVFWYNIFFCVMVPILTVVYMFYLFIYYSLGYVLFLLLITYLYYFVVSCILFVFYLLLVSERKKYDFTFMYLLPIMPVYQFTGRIWTAVSIIFEIVLHTHKDSSMAPWWVIRKTH